MRDVQNFICSLQTHSLADMLYVGASRVTYIFRAMSLSLKECRAEVASRRAGMGTAERSMVCASKQARTGLLPTVGKVYTATSSG